MKKKLLGVLFVLGLLLALLAPQELRQTLDERQSAALEARLFDGKPLARPCGRAKKEKAAAAHGGAK